MMRSGTRARHDGNVVYCRLAKQPARPYALFRRLGFREFGATEAQLLGVPVVSRLGIRRQNVDMVHAGGRRPLVQMVLLNKPRHRLDLGVVIDDEAERILDAQRAALAEHLVARPAHRQAELLEAHLHPVEAAVIGHYEADLTHAGRLRLAQDEAMMLSVLGAAQIDATVIARGLVQADQIDVEIPGALQVGGAKLDVPTAVDDGDVVDAAFAHAAPPEPVGAHYSVPHIDTPGTTDQPSSATGERKWQRSCLRPARRMRLA